MEDRTRSLFFGGLILVLAFVAGSVWSGMRGTGPTLGDPVDAAVLVRDDSHVLGERGSSDVEVVEFLDFQCPPCGQMHPVVEDAREKYDGEVTFVLRQFPLSSHVHAHRAALAAEAAAAQGLLDPMYKALFASQDEWSDIGDAGEAEAFFRDLAGDVGVDLTRYDTDVASPAIAERVARDVTDGGTVGVAGTPSFFVGGRPVTLSKDEDLDTAIAEALS